MKMTYLLIMISAFATFSTIHGQIEIPIKWENALETPYIEGPLYLGSSMVPISAMYLFNYEETAIVSGECTNCPIPKYDPAYSLKKSELNTTWDDTLEIHMSQE